MPSNIIDKILGKKNKRQYLYFYRMDFKKGRHLHKIGVSDSIDRRERGISKDFKCDLTTEYKGEILMAYKVEKFLHRIFHRRRTKRFTRSKPAGYTEVFKLNILQVFCIKFFLKSLFFAEFFVSWVLIICTFFVLIKTLK